MFIKSGLSGDREISCYAEYGYFVALQLRFSLSFLSHIIEIFKKTFVDVLIQRITKFELHSV